VSVELACNEVRGEGALKLEVEALKHLMIIKFSNFDNDNQMILVYVLEMHWLYIRLVIEFGDDWLNFLGMTRNPPTVAM